MKAVITIADGTITVETPDPAPTAAGVAPSLFVKWLTEVAADPNLDGFISAKSDVTGWDVSPNQILMAVLVELAERDFGVVRDGP